MKAFKSQWYRPLHLSRAWARMTAADVARMDQHYEVWRRIKAEQSAYTANLCLIAGLDLDRRPVPSVHGPLFDWSN